MRSLAASPRDAARRCANDLLRVTADLMVAMERRPEDTEGAARDLLILAEAALAKAQEVVSHLRARLGEQSDA